MPSRTSMWRHWLRSCWVAQLYQSASGWTPTLGVCQQQNN